MLETEIIRKMNPTWKNFYPRGTVPVLIGKKIKHVQDLIASLAIRGPSTIPYCAKYVISREKNSAQETSGLQIRTQNFHNLIRDTKKKDHKYAGLISEHYIIKTGKTISKDNRKAELYALTLKGCLLALGYQFDDRELASFIKYASQNHLYFAYINKVLQQTSISFVKEIFIQPIQDLIKKGKITLDDNIVFYFSNLADASEYVLYTKLTNIQKEFFDSKKNKKITLAEFEKYAGNSEIEVLMKNTFYVQQPREDWIDRIVNYFYNKDNELEFYESYCDGTHETILLYRVMSRIHFAYYDAVNLGYAAKQTNKLPPHSKRWKLDMNYKRMYPPPKESPLSIRLRKEYEEYLRKH